MKIFLSPSLGLCCLWIIRRGLWVHVLDVGLSWRKGLCVFSSVQLPVIKYLVAHQYESPCVKYIFHSIYQILEQSNQTNSTAMGWYQFTFVCYSIESQMQDVITQNKIHALNLQNRFYLDYYYIHVYNSFTSAPSTVNSFWNIAGCKLCFFSMLL